MLKKGEGRGEREENPQIMEEKCGEPLDIADEREKEEAAWRIPMLYSVYQTSQPTTLLPTNYTKIN